MSANTPLAQFLRDATPEERDETAALAGTTTGNLYQYAGCHRTNPGVRLALGIVDATRIMAERSNGRLKAVSIEQLASMCFANDFSDC